MGFNQVYQQLRDLFPTIDARIVKAVSIENSHDVAAAVSVILDEVIPSVSASPSQMPVSPPKPLFLTPQKPLSPTPQMPVSCTPPKHLSPAPQKPLTPTPLKPVSPPQVEVYSTPRQKLQISAKTTNGEVGHGDEGLSLKKKQTEEAFSSSSPVPVSSLTNLGNNASHSYDNGHIYSRTQIEKALNDPPNLESSSPFTQHGSSSSMVPVSSSIILGNSANHPYLKAQIEEAQALNDLDSSSSFTSHGSRSECLSTEAASSVRIAEDVKGDSGLEFFDVSSFLTQENNVNDQVCRTPDNEEPELHNTQKINDKLVQDDMLAATSSLEGQCGPVISNGQKGELEDTILPMNNDPATVTARVEDIIDNRVQDHILAATASLEGQCGAAISNGQNDESEGTILPVNNDQDTDEERIPVVLSVGLQSKIDSSAKLSEGPNDLLDSDIHQSESVSEAFDADDDDDSVLNNLVTRSGQICRVDLLEDMIEDARNNKKTLFAAMDSVISIMKEVEEKEKAAEIAKVEAAKGGLDILAKVEDLKKMLQHAKEANDMHAGEVHGEKAILATEARELQSRLLSLSDERDKSLAILDEMRQALEARLAAAEDEIRKAEEEKSVKEESARSALAEQEAIMDKVVQEAKMLQEVAEENSRLQEFLMDRGHTLDILQGEISVICHDVRLLKEKFDDRLPLSKSVSSSQTSCILASSGSSRRSLESVEVPVEGYESQKETSPAASLRVESPKTNHKEKKASNYRRELVDDGWELFENDA